MLKKSDTKTLSKIFLLCLGFIVIIAYISIQSIGSVTTAIESFESFHGNQHATIQNLDRISRDLLQIRINMIQEQDAGERGNMKEAALRRASSQKLAADYTELWKKVRNALVRQGRTELAARWERQVKRPVETRELFHRALVRGDFRRSQAYLAAWLPDYRALRDTTFHIALLQAKEGEAVQAVMMKGTRSAIVRSYIVLGVSLALGFAITFMVILFFLNSLKKTMASERIVSKEEAEREAEIYR
ncbi:MAG TPA: hypothetical protein PKX12_08385 [Spirochaetota bacterium]|nr:hypothetical protein [Spirochaetota bacterium]